MGFWHQFYNRNTRLILTLISKQWLVFLIGTWLLWYKCITPEVWVVLAGVVIGANVWQKIAGVSPDIGKIAVPKAMEKEPEE